MVQRGREYSLWEKLFNEYEDVSQLPELLEEIRNMRNRVMHQKTISANEYNETKQKLISIIKLLDKSIDYAEKRMYTEHDKEEVARSLSDVYSTLSESLLKISKMMEPSREVSQRLQKIVTSTHNKFLEELEFPTTELGKLYSSQFKGLDFGVSAFIKSTVDRQALASPLSALADELKKYNTISNNLASAFADYKFPRLSGFDIADEDNEGEDKGDEKLEE